MSRIKLRVKESNFISILRKMYVLCEELNYLVMEVIFNRLYRWVEVLSSSGWAYNGEGFHYYIVIESLVKYNSLRRAKLISKTPFVFLCVLCSFKALIFCYACFCL